jgi:hypothetical protein
MVMVSLAEGAELLTASAPIAKSSGTEFRVGGNKKGRCRQRPEV